MKRMLFGWTRVRAGGRLVNGAGEWVNGQAKEFEPLSTQRAQRFFLFFLAYFALFAVDELEFAAQMPFGLRLESRATFFLTLFLSGIPQC